MKRGIFTDPVAVGLVAAAMSVSLGLAYLQFAGAPLRLLAMNASALLIGLVVVVLVRLGGKLPRLAREAAPIFACVILLATALFGQPVEGAARWLTVGAVTIQPSLILLPAMLVLFVRERTPATAAAVTLGLVAMALQPDRAMAAMACAGVGLTLALASDRRRFLWLAPVSLAAFLVAMARPDRLPATPFVDQILYSAPALSPLAGFAVLAGSLLLLAPVVLAIGGRNRAQLLVFGGVWCTALAAAALGNYPTPLVGYGGSAIVGYCLSVAALRSRRLAAAGGLSPSGQAASSTPPPKDMAYVGALSR